MKKFKKPYVIIKEKASKYKKLVITAALVMVPGTIPLTLGYLMYKKFIAKRKKP